MKSKHLFISTIFSIILFSCQKETDPPSVQKDTESEQHPELNKDNFGLNLNVTFRGTDYRSPLRKKVKEASLQNVFLIDVDGHRVENTSWNYNGPINAGATNMSGEDIQRIVDSIAYDYRDFNVTVTTNEDLYNRADKFHRMRLIITDSFQWFGSNAGGVSYTNSFTWGDDTPCFVFASLLNYGVKFISEAASHELGHTVGLRHQALWENGVMLKSYNDRPFNNGKFYIMGISYYGVGDFGVGLNPYGNIQDDVAVINQVLGSKIEAIKQKIKR